LLTQQNRSERLGLGVGLDLSWGAPIGFRRDPEGDRVEDRVVRFLAQHSGAFAYLFVSWQPRDRNRLAAEDYFPAYDDLFARAPAYSALGLHQTALNLGALEHYERGPIIDLSNALVERYGMGWVNEDVGVWSIHGHPLAYPLPPYLTAVGLAAAVRNTREVQERLSVPLLLEFPGFSDESISIGRLHAYDFFRDLVEDTGALVTLDLGHLLSYQWSRGRRGEALYAELERLPTQRCVEMHLSGCEVVDGRLMDFHHGLLMPEQFELLSRLLPHCPNLRVVTYEDPKFDAQGALLGRTRPSFSALQARVAQWARPSA
jgi:uncharacterized protein (UPF0276 family)